MADLMPLIAGEPSVVDVLEQTTPRYEATIVDDEGNPIPSASLTTLTLSLYVIETDGSITYINGRNAQTVLNANNGTIDANGLFTWLLQAADTSLANPLLAVERHIALFTWTWASGTRIGRHEVVFNVKNLVGVS